MIFKTNKLVLNAKAFITSLRDLHAEKNFNIMYDNYSSTHLKRELEQNNCTFTLFEIYSDIYSIQYSILRPCLIEFGSPERMPCMDDHVVNTFYLYRLTPSIFLRQSLPTDTFTTATTTAGLYTTCTKTYPLSEEVKYLYRWTNDF